MRIGIVGLQTLIPCGVQQTIIGREEDRARQASIRKYLTNDKRRCKLHCIICSQRVAFEQVTGKVYNRAFDFYKSVPGLGIFSKGIQGINMVHYRQGSLTSPSSESTTRLDHGNPRGKQKRVGLLKDSAIKPLATSFGHIVLDQCAAVKVI